MAADWKEQLVPGQRSADRLTAWCSHRSMEKEVGFHTEKFTHGSGNQTASDLTSVLEDKGDAIRTLMGIGFHLEF